MPTSEPKLISRKAAIGFSLASMAVSALMGIQFHRTLSDATVPADRAAWLMHQSANYEAETLTIKPQDKLPEALLLLLGMVVSGGSGVLLWPKEIAPAAFTPGKVERLQETGLLPYSPSEARSAFVDFFVGLAADYPYLTKMMGSNLIIVNGPSGAKKSRTACCFALMQWIHPDIKRTPYVLDAKADINNDEGTWQGIPKAHVISPSRFGAFWQRIQTENDWCIVVDEIDEWKNAGYGEVLSSIVRVSNTQPRKQRACVIICAHGDASPAGQVELTKDNLGLTDADKGKIGPVRKAANILTLGSYEDDYGRLRPTYQGTWKPGMCDDSQSRRITIPQSLDPSTFERYVIPFLESAREPVTVSPVVMELEDRLTDPSSMADLIAKFEQAYQSDDTQPINLDAVDAVGKAFLQWHFDRYGSQSYDPQARRAVLTHFSYEGNKISSEQADRLFALLEQAGIISQTTGDRGKKLYIVQITKEQI